MDRRHLGKHRLGSLGLLACGIFACGGLACWWPLPRVIEGDGNTTTENREIHGTFDAVETQGAMDLQVKVGPATAVAVTIDRNLQPYVDVHLEGTTLILEQREHLRWHGRAFSDVTVPALRAVSTSGSGQAMVDGSSGGSLSLATSGSGGIRLHGEVQRLAVSTSGSGRVALVGRVAALHVSTSGSGDVDGGALTVSGDADVSTWGSARVELVMAGGSLHACTSGSGDVLYSGEARAVDAQASGSGRIRRL
jgi:hypothetical protein